MRVFFGRTTVGVVRVSHNVDVTGEIQTRVPHQIAALPAWPFSRKIKRESREVTLGAIHYVV